MFNPNKPRQFNIEEYKKKRTEELRKHIFDTVKPEKYYKEGEKALQISDKMKLEGVYFGGKFIGCDPNEKAPEAFKLLNEETSRWVLAHGIAINVPSEYSGDKKFPLFALLQILTTGKV